MKRRSLVGGLTVATLATGLFLMQTPAASAEKAENIAAEPSGTEVRPPALSKPRVTCNSEGALVAVRLHNRNRTELSYQVRLSSGDVQQAQAVTLPARGGERAEFSGIPEGRYLIEVLDVVGDYVAQARGRVRCNVQHAPHPRGRS